MASITDAAVASGRRLLESNSTSSCSAPSHDPLIYYPDDAFSLDERRDGKLVLHFLFMFYLCIAINIVVSQRLVPATRSLSSFLSLRNDVSESLMLAAASGMPLVFVCWVGTFFNRTNIGLATMLGAVMFHYLLVMSASVWMARTRITLTWLIASRDFISYVVALTAVLFIITPLSVKFWHAIIIILLYGIYIVVLQFNDRITTWVLQMLDESERPRKRSEKGRRQSFEMLVNSTFFAVVIYLVIIANIVVIVLQFVNSTSDISALATLNQVFTAVFVAEMAMKIYVLGFFGYWKDPLNAFDGMLVYLILVEFVVSGSGYSGAVRSIRLVRVFRALRALRAARLVTNNQTGKPEFVKQASREPHPLANEGEGALPHAASVAPIRSVRGSAAASQLALPPPQQSTLLPPPNDRVLSPDAKQGHHTPANSIGGVGDAPKPRRLGTSPRPSYDRDGNKTEIRIEAANQADLEGSNHHILALPHGLIDWVMYILGFPVLLLVYLTIPDPRRVQWRGCWIFSLILSLAWLFGLVYLMIWMATIISVTISVDDSVIGLTLVAFGLTLPDLYHSLQHVAMVDRVAAEKLEILRSRTGNGILSARSAGAISIGVSEANAAALVAAASEKELTAVAVTAPSLTNNNNNNDTVPLPHAGHASGNSLIVLAPGTVGVGAHATNNSNSSLPTVTAIDVTALTSAAAPAAPPSPIPPPALHHTLAPVAGLGSIGTGSKRASGGSTAGTMSRKVTTAGGVRRTRTSQSQIPRKTRSTGRRPYDNPHLSLLLARHIFALMMGLGWPWFFYCLASSDGSSSLSIPVREAYILTIVTVIVMLTIIILLIHWLEWFLHRGIAVVAFIFWCWFIIQFVLLERGYLIDFDDCAESS